jgi:hypothetical protein
VQRLGGRELYVGLREQLHDVVHAEPRVVQLLDELRPELPGIVQREL